MSALVLSSKVWDDNSMWNRDFSEVSPSFSLARLNQLEVAVLGVLRVSYVRSFVRVLPYQYMLLLYDMIQHSRHCKYLDAYILPLLLCVSERI